MPVYEYVCRKCGHEFDELVLSAADRDQVPCPSCGAKRAGRQLSVFAARDGAPEGTTPTSGFGPAAGPCGQCDNPGGACPLAG